MHPLSHGARVVWRGNRGAPGKPGFRAGSWVIRDGRKEKRLGLAKPRRAEADRQLAEYITERGEEQSQPGGGAKQPHKYLVSEALALYGSEHAPGVADPARIGYAIMALLRYWKGKAVSEVTKKTCREYRNFRQAEGVTAGTVRTELGKLRAALRFAVSEGKLTAAPPVDLPARPPARERWLERDEAARLIRQARKSGRTRHLVRFVLIGVYTGTRSGPIRRLRWKRSLAGGHVDLARGVLYRKPAQTAETKKQQPPARLPERLIRLLKIWRRQDERFCARRGMDPDLLPIVHYYGKPIDKLRSSWRTVCEEAGLDGDVVAHSLRHTAITWAAQEGADPWQMCGFFGITMEELQRTYLHHHPDFQSSVTGAFDRRRGAR